MRKFTVTGVELIILGWTLMVLSLMAGGLYIAYHFISKIW